MSSINVSRETKREFDQLQPEDDTQDEFVQTLLETYQKDVDGVVIDPDDIADSIEEQIASKIELAAYRGVQEGIENYGK